MDLNSVMSQNQDLKKENEGLQEQLIDLKGRSMRDNLLFSNFPEPQVDPKNEPSIIKIYDFC